MVRYNHRNAHRAAGFVLSLVMVFLCSGPAFAEQPTKNNPKPGGQSSAWSTPIALFQKTLSKADGSRCPMYPSCSHYSRQAFARHNPITAWVLTADRLLRCGRDETRRSRPVIVQGKPRIKDTLADNTFWWSTP